MIRGRVVRWSRVSRAFLAPLLCALVLLSATLWVGQARAHHEESHRVLVLGVQTMLLFRANVCALKEQAEYIMDEHERGGHDAAMTAWNLLSGYDNEYNRPVCALMVAFITPIAIHKQVELEYPQGIKTGKLVEIQMTFLIGGRLLNIEEHFFIPGFSHEVLESWTEEEEDV